MKKFTKNLLAVCSTILVRAIKLLPANFSPVGSFGFFSKQPIFYFLSIIAFDLFFGGFYLGFQWVYLAFAIYPLLGFLAKDKLKLKLILLPAASLLFFLISNFGVWLSWYSRDFAGFSQCYLLALPFYARTLMGDLVFGYGYLLLKKPIKNLISSYQSYLNPSL